MSGRTAADRRAQAQHRRTLVVSGVLAATALAGAGLFLAQDGSGDRPAVLRAAAALPPLEVDSGVVHVHGLGVDPGDGVLYAATHTGLFRLPEQGGAERVANRAQDTMGFSVVGPGRFIGSGHPDPREDDVRPPLLGLIESGDRGETWDRISLHGEADFHALHAAHGNVYGYDATSGTFMVSADREQWDRRSQLPIADFAVSPTDPDTVLAATQDGVVRSADGGRTWAGVVGAPAAVVLAWGARGSLYAVEPDGDVHHSGDGGTSWQHRGDAGGEPEALTLDPRAGDETVYAAVSGRGIVTSADGGRTFTTRSSD